MSPDYHDQGRTMIDDQSSKQRRLEAHQRYRAHRKEASERMSPWLATITSHSVSLDDITDAAVAQAKGWRKTFPEIRQSNWDWGKLVKSFRRRSRHIELAIWVNQILCALLVGRISDNRIVATVYFLERRPLDNPLAGSIAMIASRYVETLAVLLDCKQTALDSPLPALIDFYKKLGYTSVTTKGKKVVRLVKTLRM